MRFIKDGVIKSRNEIVLRVTKEINGKEYKVQVVCPNDEMLAEHGWMPYVEPEVDPQPTKKGIDEIVQELVVKQYNTRTDISNEEALDYIAIIYPWEFYLDKTLEVGMMVTYEDKPWRVRQTHAPLEVYPPSLDTASLYEAIDKEHSGEADDPIPYMPPMEVFEGKHYEQYGVVYLCTRSSGVALTHDLSALVGHYVTTI